MWSLKRDIISLTPILTGAFWTLSSIFFHSLNENVDFPFRFLSPIISLAVRDLQSAHLEFIQSSEVESHENLSTMSCGFVGSCSEDFGSQLFRPFMKYTAFSHISQRQVAWGMSRLKTYSLFCLINSYNWRNDSLWSKFPTKVSFDSTFVAEHPLAMSNKSFSVHNKYCFCLKIFWPFTLPI